MALRKKKPTPEVVEEEAPVEEAPVAQARPKREGVQPYKARTLDSRSVERRLRLQRGER